MADELTVSIRGNDINLSALLQRMQQEGQRTDLALTQAGQRIAAAMNGTVQPTLQEAQALARLAAAGGQGAQGVQILEQALSRETSITNQNISATTQLINLEQRLAREASGATSGIGSLTGALNTVQSALGGVGIAFGAQAIIGGAISLAQSGAAATQAAQSFDRLTASAGQSGTTLLAALRQASHGEISDMNLQLAATRAQVLGVAHSTQDFSALMEIARSRAQLLGTSTTQAFDDLVTGLGRGSALILDNLGITVKVGEANEVYAKSIGKTVTALTASEQKQALVNAVLLQGRDTLKQTGDAADTAAQKYARLETNLENIKNKAGSALAALSASPIDNLSKSLSTGDNLQAGREKATVDARSYQEYTAALQKLNAELGISGNARAAAAARQAVLTQAQFQYVQALERGGVAAGQAIQQTQSLSTSQIAYAQRLIQTGTSAQQSFQAVSTGNQIVTALDTSMARAAGSNQQMATTLQQIAPAALAAGAGSAANAAQVTYLVQAYSNGIISAQYLQAQLTQLTTAHTIAGQAAATEAALQLQRTGEINEGTASTAAMSQAVTVNTQALAESATQSQQTAQQTAALTAIQQSLAAIGPAVAGGLISDASAAAQLASQYNIATGAALQLVRAQAQLGQAKAAAGALRDQRAGERDAGNTRIRYTHSEGQNGIELSSRGADTYDQVARAADTARAQAAAEREVAAARADQIKATGTVAQKQAELNRELQTAKRLYGENSVEAIRAQTALMQAQEAGARGSKGRKAGGGGAGGTKLSDQQKLNNQLLAGQTQYENQSEDATAAHEKREADLEKDHAAKLLSIQADFAAKMKAAQNAVNLGSLQGRTSFYKSLADVEDAGLRQQASARYEAAQQEAAQIGKDKGPDAAKAYLDTQRQAIQDELELQKEIADAQKAGDQDKANYLSGVLALQQQADAEQMRQIQEQGSAITNARDQQLSDEQAAYAKATGEEADKYNDAQAKIKQSSQRATDAKIANAQRAGKAVDVENAGLERQGKLLDQIGAKAGGKATGAASGDAAPDTAKTSAPTPAENVPSSKKSTGLTGDLSGLISKLNEVLGALRKIDGDIVSGNRNVEGAVGRLGNLVK